MSVVQDEFDNNVIFDKMANINTKLEEELSKSDDEVDNKRVKELIYAQFIQGLKLNTILNNKYKF